MKTIRSEQGLSLIELMIVVAIIGIIATIAYPAYTDHVNDSRRAEAMAALLSLAASQERFYTANKLYAAPASMAALGSTGASETGLYTLTTAYASGTATYVLTATPTWGDAECGNFLLSNIGARGVSVDIDGDSNVGTADPDDAAQCWE